MAVVSWEAEKGGQATAGTLSASHRTDKCHATDRGQRAEQLWAVQTIRAKRAVQTIRAKRAVQTIRAKSSSEGIVAVSEQAATGPSCRPGKGDEGGAWGVQRKRKPEQGHNVSLVS